jgi:hypothetical protein
MTSWRYAALLMWRFRERMASFLGLALGELALEVGTAVRAGLADLADRREVQGVVEAPVASLGDAVHDSSARRTFDGCGAVAGGGGVSVGETADVAAETGLARAHPARAVPEPRCRYWDARRNPAAETAGSSAASKPSAGSS